MRLIDADALKQFIGNDTILKNNICRMIDVQPTAYDVEAAVAELEKVAFERFGNDGIGGQKVVSLDDAISIVRGKE